MGGLPRQPQSRPSSNFVARCSTFIQSSQMPIERDHTGSRTVNRQTKRQDAKRPERAGPQYLASAPAVLVELHRSGAALGRKILGDLLTDEAMLTGWKVLARRVKRDEAWTNLWNEIRWNVRVAKAEPISREQERDTLLCIKSQALQLVKSVNAVDIGDFRAYELFPPEVMSILGIPNWPSLNRLERARSAFRLLLEWPSVAEALETLADSATELADLAMRTKRSERKTRDQKPRRFARGLCAYLMTTYEYRLYGTVANIASVIYKSKIAKSQVENWVKS